MGQKQYADYIAKSNSEIERYNGLEDKIYTAVKERETLIAEKKNTLFLNFSKHKKLDTRIAELTELLKKLNSKKTALLKYFDCANDDGIFKVRKYIADTEAGLEKFNEQEKTYSEKIDSALKKYAELQEHGAEFDTAELYEARQAIRSDKEKLAERQLRKAYGEKYNSAFLSKSRTEASRLLNEDSEKRNITEKIPKSQPIIEQQVKKRINKRVRR